MLINALSNKAGGGYRVAVQLIQALDEAKASMTVLHTWADSRIPLTSEAVRFHRLPLASPALRVLFEQFLPVISRVGQYELLVNLGSTGPIFADTRSVLVVHNLSPLAPGLERLPWRGRLRRRLLGWLIRQSSLKAGAVVVTAEWLAKDPVVRRLLANRTPEVMPIGLEIGDPVPSKAKAEAAVQQRWLVPVPYLLAVGDVYPHKNYTRVITAFERLTHRLPFPLLLVIAGAPLDLDESRSIRLAVHRLQLSDKVRLLGGVSRSELPDLYRASLGVVCASLVEASPSVPVESVYFGSPVLASRIAAHAELLEDEWLFDPVRAEDIEIALERLAFRQVGVPTLRRHYLWKDAARRLLEIARSIPLEITKGGH